MKEIRNVAVIAHVDHGKTTLIDALLKQTDVFRSNQEEMAQERILDSDSQERERGITITAKNCSVEYHGTKINIIDTPGHADFSGEVERTLGMAEGALLIIDAQDGPMPQTRFVLRRAFDIGLAVIVVINKIDKPYARIPYVLQKTEDLFLELAHTDSQLEFPVLYAVAREGKVYTELPKDMEATADVSPLLEQIVKYIPAPKRDESEFRMLVSSFEYDNHLGRILIGKIQGGEVRPGDKVLVAGEEVVSHKIDKVFLSRGLLREESEVAEAGDIAGVAGVEGAGIGDTLIKTPGVAALAGIEVSAPTMHISIGPNTSPFAGQEGKFSTSRQLEERLKQELERNLSLSMKKIDGGRFSVSGRGELHLAVFIENLRREGYELEAERPEVIIKEEDGIKKEPFEELQIVVPNEYVGVINQELGKRHGALISTEQIGEGETEFLYHIPTRAMMGLRSVLMSSTRGTSVMNSQFLEYRPMGREVAKERSGVLIASASGEALSYGLQAAQGRGITFIDPGTSVYEGMIVGKNSRNEDIAINVTKGKKLTNMRSSSSDGIIQLAPASEMSLERALEFLEADELLEITPKALRLRKKYLTEDARRKHLRKNRGAAASASL